MKHTRFAQESAAQAQAEAQEKQAKHTSDMRPHGSDRFGNPCECEGCEEWDAQSRAEMRKCTRQNKAWDLAKQIYWAVVLDERRRAEQLLDTWADERKPIA